MFKTWSLGFHQEAPIIDINVDERIEQAIGQHEVESELLGADSVLPIAGATYTLSGSGLSSSATSIVLSSLTIPQTKIYS